MAGALTLASKDDDVTPAISLAPGRRRWWYPRDSQLSRGHLVYTSKLAVAWADESGNNLIDEFALIVSPSVDYTQEYTDNSCVLVTIPTAYQQLHDEVAGPLSDGLFHMGTVDDPKKTLGGARDDDARAFRTTLYILLTLASLAIIIFMISKLSSASRSPKVRSRK